MLESNVTVNGTIINLAALSVDDLTRLHSAIAREVHSRRRAAERELVVPPIFPGASP